MACNFSGRLILTRHAHRDMSDPYADNGLSEKGWTQARKLADDLSPLLSKMSSIGAAKSKILIISSPKVRCQETIAPLAERLKQLIEIDSRLDTQLQAETSAAFRKRISDFGRWFANEQNKSTTIYVICSHGDWIPEFTGEFCEKEINLSKGQYITF